MSHPLRADISYDHGIALSRQGKHAEAIACFERALASDPTDTRVLFALGNTARALGMAKPAESFYRQVLTAEPDRIEALINLANLLRSSGQLETAKALLEPALARGPSAELSLTLGTVLRDAGDMRGAEENYRDALALKPNYVAAQSNLADMLATNGAYDEALALYDRAIHGDPEKPQPRLNRAILHLLRGNLKEGWRDYAARLKISGKAPVCDHGLPAWTGGSLNNKRLLVTAEQGIGDQLMFASMIPELSRRAMEEGGSIVFECEPRLVSLFARSFPDVAVRASQMEMRGGIVYSNYAWLKSIGGANLAIEMGSLPRYLRKDIASFPSPHAYLDADETEILDWQHALSKSAAGPFIGICWRSGKMTNGRSLQFAPLKMWAEFIRNMPGTPVCVQYDASSEEIETLSRLAGRAVVVPNGVDQKNELDRTCALLSSLDAVISAPTAVSWLSAGAGVPTSKILYDNSWTSFGEKHEPFAPSCVCMMPQTPGDWSAVFNQTLVQLNSRF
ncbi:MAG TPA: tetratricopeptide repeat protein [Rhizomicrobium sp.]|nr:tetratricopeptide repeat protein [Rhizomicrobium sp.]